MEFHPFAEKFPLIKDQDADAWFEFKAGIKATKGNKEDPIHFRLVNGDMQGLDGRNRELACKELKIKPTYKKVVVPDEEVIDFILRKNVHRRHLDTDFRRVLVRELRAEGESTRAIAEQLKIGQTTVLRDLKADSQSQVNRSGSPDKIVGEDGKQYSPTKTTPGDADETEILCDRCARVGKAKDCPKCKKAQEKAAQKGKRRAPSKSGKPLIDWKEFEKHFGPVMRLPDQIVRAYPDEKKQWEYTEASKLMDKLAELVKEWKTRLLKVKP